MEAKKDINVCLIENWMSICKWIKSHYQFYWNLKIRVEGDLYLKIKANENIVILEEWHPGFYKNITEDKSSDGYKFDDYLNNKRNLSEYDIQYLKILMLHWVNVKSCIENQTDEYSKIQDFKV